MKLDAMDLNFSQAIDDTFFKTGHSNDLKSYSVGNVRQFF
jgi:hypothetical protein